MCMDATLILNALINESHAMPYSVKQKRKTAIMKLQSFSFVSERQDTLN